VRKSHSNVPDQPRALTLALSHSLHYVTRAEGCPPQRPRRHRLAVRPVPLLRWAVFEAAQWPPGAADPTTATTKTSPTGSTTTVPVSAPRSARIFLVVGG
jgi:hypothetical protein